MSQRWVSEISPNETFSALVGVAEWFNAVSKVSAESQTQGLILATQVAFSKIITLSSRTCFFRPWQIKCCMLSCQQIEILIQIEKPVHVSSEQDLVENPNLLPSVDAFLIEKASLSTHYSFKASSLLFTDSNLRIVLVLWRLLILNLLTPGGPELNITPGIYLNACRKTFPKLWKVVIHAH